MRKVASSFKYKMAQAICLVRKTELYTDIVICILNQYTKLQKLKASDIRVEQVSH